jgi:hypothetical protein
MSESTKQQLLVISMILILSLPAVKTVYGQQGESNSGEREQGELIFSPPYLVEHTVSEMQHDPGEEEILFDALKIEMRFREPLFLTKKAAKDDVERLFYLLENGYAGYGYFDDWGDYPKAKENILMVLDEKTLLRSSELSDIIHDNLGFLHDCHLSIGDHDYGEHYDFWFDKDHELRENEQGYSFVHDGEKYVVLSINGETPDSFIFPSLNLDGEKVSRIGLLSPIPPTPLDVTAENTGGPIHLELELVKSQPTRGNLFTENIVGGVPVIRIGSFSDHNIEYVDQFLECASKYKDEPCLVVDIRGNGGGNTAYAKQWVTRYTGNTPGSIQIYSELVSETSMMGRSNYFSYLLHNYPELEDQGYLQKADLFRSYSEQVEEKDMNAHWSSYNVPAPKMIPCNKTLIVLVDQDVGSAAEGFLCYLQQVDNVVLVGENSGGAVTYGQMTMHMLPNSRLSVWLPISLNVFTDLVYREEMGFYPDYWVPAEDAVNYVVAAVRAGSIVASESYVDQVSDVEFIPQSLPMRNIGVWDVLPFVLLLFYGGVFVFFNRKRDWRVFFIGGILAGYLGLHFYSQTLSLSYVFLFTGFEYLLIALYKRGKNREEKSELAT